MPRRSPRASSARRATGALLMHAYDQREVVIGAGTLAAEVEADAGVPDRALVSVGGGGLIAGIAAWFQDRCRIEALEPELAPTLFRARAAGAPVDVAVSGIAADSLGARRIGAIAWDVTQRHVDAAHLLARRRHPRRAARALERAAPGRRAGGGAAAGRARDPHRRAAPRRARAARDLRRQRRSGVAAATASLSDVPLFVVRDGPAGASQGAGCAAMKPIRPWYFGDVAGSCVTYCSEPQAPHFDHPPMSPYWFIVSPPAATQWA